MKLQEINSQPKGTDIAAAAEEKHKITVNIVRVCMV